MLFVNYNLIICNNTLLLQQNNCTYAIGLFINYICFAIFKLILLIRNREIWFTFYIL